MNELKIYRNGKSTEWYVDCPVVSISVPVHRNCTQEESLRKRCPFMYGINDSREYVKCACEKHEVS